MTTITDSMAGGEADAEAGRRSSGLAWLVVGLLSLVAFELTADPALAVTLGCLKFGVDDLATARWLRKTDPDRRRGLACGLFHAGWSLWRVSGVAVGMMVLLALTLGPLLDAMRARGANVPDMPGEFVSAAVVAAVGTLAAGLTTLVAIASAWPGRIKVWVGPESRRARLGGSWPPTRAAGRPPGENRLTWVVVGPPLPIAAAGVIALSLPAIHLLRMLGLPPRGSLIYFLTGLLMLGGILTALALIVGVVGGLILPRIGAKSPGECWPAGAGPRQSAGDDA